MSLLPKHRFSRIAAALWLLAGAAFLLLTLVKLDLTPDERSALAHLVPVYFLGFPSSHIAVAAASKIKLALYLHDRFEPNLFSECVYLWTLMMVLGYVQWFILLPWVSRRCRQACNRMFNRNGKVTAKNS